MQQFLRLSLDRWCIKEGEENEGMLVALWSLFEVEHEPS